MDPSGTYPPPNVADRQQKQVAESSKPKQPEPEASAFNGAALQHNAFVLTYCRTALAAVSGCAAGILGLTALSGFLFYVLASAYLSALLLAKTGSGTKRFFLSPWALCASGVMGELITYIMFWTFLYGMVHVY